MRGAGRFFSATILLMGLRFLDGTAGAIDSERAVNTTGESGDDGNRAAVEATADTVFVTATRLSQDHFQQPYAIYRQDRNDLDGTNARTLTDRLHFAPGLFVQHTASNQASPFVRGLTGEQSLLLFDGIRLSHAGMRSGPNQYAALIADESIEAIDVILGGSSVVTGSDGLTGAVDFRLAPPGRGQTGTSAWVRSRMSSSDGLTAAAGLDGGRRHLSYTLEGSWTDQTDRTGGRHADSRIFGPAGRQTDKIPHSGYEQASFAGRAAWTGWPYHYLQLSVGQLSQTDAPRPDGYYENSGDPSRIARWFDPQRFRYLHLLHRLETQSAALKSLQARLWSHQHYEEQFREDIADFGRLDPVSGEPVDRFRRREYRDTIDILGIDLQGTSRPRRNHSLTWGMTWSTESTNDAYREFRSPAGNTDPAAATPYKTADWAAKTSLPSGAEYRSLGLYIQDQWRLAGPLQAILGSRYSRAAWRADLAGRGYTVEEADGSAANVSSSLRLSFDITARNLVFAGVSQGFRAPNLTNLTGNQDRASSGDFFQGNPDLEPERSATFEMGWRVSQSAEAEQRLGPYCRWLALSVFTTRVDDLMQRVFRDVDGDGTPEGIMTNAESARLRGFELGANVPLPLFAAADERRYLVLKSAASLVRATVDVPQPDGAVRQEYISRANRLFGWIGLRYERRDAWWLESRLRWSDAYDRVSPLDAEDVRMTVAGDPDGGMPGYGAIDVTACWRGLGPHQTVRLSLENVFDVTYRDVGSAVDGTGRSVVLSFDLRI